MSAIKFAAKNLRLLDERIAMTIKAKRADVFLLDSERSVDADRWGGALSNDEKPDQIACVSS